MLSCTPTVSTLQGLRPRGYGPHLQVGAFKLLQIRSVHREILSLLIYPIRYGDTDVQSLSTFPAQLVPIISPHIELDTVNDWHETIGKNVH